MDETVESVKSCIESSEGILYKRCTQLREYLFMSDDYDLATVQMLASDIKLISDIIISQCKKLLNENI